MSSLSRRSLLKQALLGGAMIALPPSLLACGRGGAHETDEGDVLPEAEPMPAVGVQDRERLREWSAALRRTGYASLSSPLGRAAARVGELAIGTPYEAFTLEAYLHAGGSPSRTEPLTLSLTRFDCVSLVEACLAIARAARLAGDVTWERFGYEMERMRYRGGVRGGYVSRLHYFSEWISDGAQRGLVRDLGPELGGEEDRRPLRFMTGHRDSYPGLADDEVFRGIAAVERQLDASPRHVIPTARIEAVSRRLETGDVLAFATSISGLDVSHAAFAYRDSRGVMRVLHAPLSGGVVEITRSTLPAYVAGIRHATGIIVARPLST